MAKTFYQNFSYAINCAGLSAPVSLFETQAKAVATIETILRVLKSLGPTTSIRTIIGAGTKLEALSVVAAVGAAYYAGACVGALIYAASSWTSEQVAGASAMKVSAVQSQALSFGLVVPSKIAALTKAHSFSTINASVA